MASNEVGAVIASRPRSRCGSTIDLLSVLLCWRVGVSIVRGVLLLNQENPRVLSSKKLDRARAI